MATNGSDTNSNGQSDVQFDFTPAVPGVDKVSNEVMAEIFRRAQGFVGGGVTGAVAYGPVPPQDKSLLWDPGDGNIYRYDPDTGQWVTGNQNEISYPGLSEATDQQLADDGTGLYFTQQYGQIVHHEHVVTTAGDEPINVALTGFHNDEYAVIVTPLYDAAAGYWWETGRSVTNASITYNDSGWVDPSPAQFIVRVTVIEKLSTSNYTAP